MSASWSSVLAEYANVVKLIEANRVYAQGTFLTDLAAIEAAADLDPPFIGAAQTALSATRQQAVALMRAGSSPISSRIGELGLLMGLPSSVVANGSALMAQIRSYMVTNNLAFQSRQFKRGSLGGFSAVGSPVGPNSFYPLFVDEDGFELECGLPDVISAECIKDTYTGLALKGQEAFSLSGLILTDLLDLYQANRGTGVYDTVTALSADSGSFLTNPSFGSFAGTSAAAPSSITGWTVFSDGTYTGVIATNIQVDQTNYYRSAVYEGTTPGSLVFKGGAGNKPCAVYQTPAANGKRIPKGDPTFFAFRWKADGNATAWTGTFSVYVGSKVYTVTVSGQTGWNTVVLDLSTIGASSYLNKNCYLKNYAASATGPGGHTVSGTSVMIVATPTAGGTSQLNFDDVVWAPFSVPGYNQNPLGGPTGGWLVPFAILGSSTPWVAGDSFTATWTEVGAKIQRVNARFFSPIGSLHETADGSPTTTTPVFSLPSLPAAPDSSGTTATDGGGSGALSAGVYKYYVTFVTNQGVESGISAAVTSPSLAGSHKCQLTGVPTGTAGLIAARRIYRTKAGGSTYYLNVAATAAFADNSTTAYLDNVADAALVTQIGAQQLAGITTADP